MRGNVLDHEPHLALFVSDDDPLIFYRAISGWALAVLKPGGYCIVEINEALGPETAAIYEAAGYEVHLTNAKSGDGIEQILGLLRGKTTVLAGPSGVGKSTITNEIQPEAEMETGSISEKIKRGKHTTRHSELFFVETDTYVMDTPGFSSMFVDNMKPEELQKYFPEFDEFILDCRFLGCVHVGERECGVKDAVKEGTLSKARYENYRLIYEELKNKRRY